MKILLTCTECIRQAVAAGGTAEDAFFKWMAVQDLSDSNTYEATCSEGHTVQLVLQNLRHEILFDAASLAILDGYHREAIASYACALERFLEFFVRVVFFHLTPPDDAQDPTGRWKAQCGSLDQTWKWAEKQSERQVGMFLLAHLLLTGAPPPLPKSEFEKRMAERNTVVHAGKFVSREEALAFGDYVGRLIVDLSTLLDRECPKAVSSETFRRLAADKEKLSPGGLPVSTGGSSCLLHQMADERQADFGALVDEFGRKNPWLTRIRTIERLAAQVGVGMGELAEHVRELEKSVQKREIEKGGPSER